MGNNFSSINEQYTNIRLLIGLKENEKLKELNAILQCLFHVTPLVDYFKYKFDKIEDIESYKSFHKKKICLTDSLKELIDKVWPKDVKGKSEGNLQEISKIEESKELLEMIYKIKPDYDENQEFLINFIIMTLHKELNKVKNPNQKYVQSSQLSKELGLNAFKENMIKEHQSKISDYCFGTYYMWTYCSNCRKNFYSFQPYMYGFYSLDQVYNYKFKTIQYRCNELYMNRMYNLYEVNIYDCLYFDTQVNYCMLTCKQCKMMTQCSFKNIIYLSPKILIFIFNQNIFLYNARFIIEEVINISLFVEKKNFINYNLIGIIYKLSQNNYRAFCKSPIDKQWYGYDDSKVQMMNNLQQIIMGHGIPYILFYQVSENNNNINNNNINNNG